MSNAIVFPRRLPVGANRAALQAASEAKRRYISSHLMQLYANTNPAELWNCIVKYRFQPPGCETPSGSDAIESYEELRIDYDGYHRLVHELVFHISPEEEHASTEEEKQRRRELYFSHPFLSPSTFLSFERRGDDGTILAVPMYAYAAKRLLLYRLRVELELVASVPPPALQDQASQVAGRLTAAHCFSSPLSNGLTQDDVETFVNDLVPNLRLVRDMPPWMLPYYLCHASRKFFFMCDTRNVGSISIENAMKSEVFSELLRMFESDANDAIITFPEGSVVDVGAPLVLADGAEDETVPAIVLSFTNTGSDLADVYTVKSLTDDEKVLQLRRDQLYWNSGSADFFPADVLNMDNWFSLALMCRVYEHFTSLDADGDGVLTPEELANYSSGSFIRLAIDRVFECHVPPSGDRQIMDYKTYLNFVIATEHAAARPSLKYIWSILDLDATKDHIEIHVLRCFCKEIAEQLILRGLMTDISAQSILSEIVDMINPAWHEWVTMDDIEKSGHQATVLPILLSYRNFYAYDCREQTAAAASDEYAEIGEV